MDHEDDPQPVNNDRVQESDTESFILPLTGNKLLISAKKQCFFFFFFTYLWSDRERCCCKIICFRALFQGLLILAYGVALTRLIFLIISTLETGEKYKMNKPPHTKIFMESLKSTLDRQDRMG